MRSQLERALEQAKVIGKQDRAHFQNEFKADPEVDNIGDWDSQAWLLAWIEIHTTYRIGACDFHAYSKLKDAYMSSLFDYSVESV